MSPIRLNACSYSKSQSTPHTNDEKSRSQPSTAATTTTRSNPADKSDSRWLKDSGYENMYHFMLAYGLKMHNDEDYEEGKAILKSLREGEQEEYEMAKGKK